MVSVTNGSSRKSHDWISLREIQVGGGTKIKTCPAGAGLCFLLADFAQVRLGKICQQKNPTTIVAGF